MGKDLWNAVYSQRELIFRMLASCILGGAIGFERKHRHKGAGMRTHALVCLGSALMMIVSKYGFTDFPDIDRSRIAAQVVSGIGFLGAGVIFVRNNAVNGLTNAAGLWVTSGIGLSIGAGQWVLSTIATVIVICVQFVLHNIRVLANEPYRANVRVFHSFCISNGIFQRSYTSCQFSALKLNNTDDSLLIWRDLDGFFGSSGNLFYFPYSFFFSHSVLSPIRLLRY